MENKINYEYTIISKNPISDENWNQMSELDEVKGVFDRSDFVEVVSSSEYGEIVSVIHNTLAEDEFQLELIIRANIEGKHEQQRQT